MCHEGMKQVCLIFFIITQLSCFGQFDKSITLRATANFNFALNGLATNDAGVGLGIDASFFSKHRLQALIETSADWFIGDKLLVLDSATGKAAKSAAVHSVKIGPQIFITKNLAVSATYGPAWYTVRDFNYSMDYGFKYSVTGFLGDKRRFTAKVFIVDIPTKQRSVLYLGLAAGVRF
jgi:hypothetical protein